MQNVQIRVAALQDAQTLAELGATTFEETYAEMEQSERDLQNMYLYIQQVFNPPAISLNLQNEKITYLIARRDTEDIGYAKLVRDSKPNEQEYGKLINLEKIYARKTMIGKGIGRLMLDKTLEIARTERFDYIWLSVWSANVRAVEFYKKCGFEVGGKALFHMGNDVYEDFFMKKSLL